MSSLFTINKLYTFILLILPTLIASSWLNNYFGNYTYTFDNYLLTHVLPAMGVSYIITLITAEYLNTLYEYTYARVLFTLVSVTATLFLFSYALTFFGFDAFFLTAKIPAEIPANAQTVLGIKASDPFEAASKIYSFQLVGAMVLLVVFYTTSMYLFKSKNVSVTEAFTAKKSDSETENKSRKKTIKSQKIKHRKKK